MNERMKLAGIAAATVLAAAGLFSYCSPYQTCVRAATEQALTDDAAQLERTAGAIAENNALATNEHERMGPNPYTPLADDEAKRMAQIKCAESND